jgi:hypothetical protein
VEGGNIAVALLVARDPEARVEAAARKELKQARAAVHAENVRGSGGTA